MSENESNSIDSSDSPLSENNVESVSELLMDEGADDAGDEYESDDSTPDGTDLPFGSFKEPREDKTQDDSDSDDSDSLDSDSQASNQPQPTQQQVQNKQVIEHRVQELQGAVQELNHLVQTNQISHEQYNYALQNAQGQYNDIAQADMARREQLFTQQQHQQVYQNDINKQITELIPSWNNPNNRQKIVDQVSNYAIDELGLSRAQVDSISDPMILAKVHQKMTARNKAIENDQIKRIRATKKRKATMRKKAKVNDSSQYNTGIESQIDDIAKLLG